MPQLDDYGRHEVLHMANFLSSAVDTELCEHEAIKTNPEWLKLAQQAADLLAELYQAIGQQHL
jgi:hypothetical protein